MASNVIVYSKSQCVQCEHTKSYLDRKGVIYEVVDISEDQEALEKLTSLGYRQVPVVQFGDQHWSGFQPAKLNSISN